MKRIKNANGTGSVTKTTKRKPYRVRVTDWKTKKRVSLGYYETRKQAIRERGLPFYVGQAKYKDEVYQAMKDAEQGKNLSKGYNDVEEMFEDILRDE